MDSLVLTRQLRVKNLEESRAPGLLVLDHRRLRKEDVANIAASKCGRDRGDRRRWRTQMLS